MPRGRHLFYTIQAEAAKHIVSAGMRVQTSMILYHTALNFSTNMPNLLFTFKEIKSLN